MNDDIILNEDNLTDVHHVGVAGKVKVKLNLIAAKWKAMTKRQRFVYGGGAGVVVLLLVVTIGAVALSGKNDSGSLHNNLSDNNNVALITPEEPKTKTLPLTGEYVTEATYNEVIARPAVAIVVENTPEARNQSSLSLADVVFETLVEGGITRFVPIFHSQDAETVGPVRSMRKYFIDFFGGYDDPIVMHIGYAQTDSHDTNALGYLYEANVKTLGLYGGTAWRVSDRVAPHNAYTSTVALRSTADAKGWTHAPNFTTWEFKDPTTVSADSEGLIKQITVLWDNTGADAWTVQWQLDADKDEYLRSHFSPSTGQYVEHSDAITGEQLSFPNVLIIKTNVAFSGDDKGRVIVDATGSGSALLFRDGTLIPGTWTKPSRTDRYMITDSLDKPVEFNRGATWIMVVPTTADIQY